MPFLLMTLKRGLLPLLLLSVLLPAFAIAQTCKTTIAATTEHLVDLNNGTISDPKTGLIWKKCSEGQAYNSASNSCDNNISTYVWSTALQQAQDVNAGSSGENLGKTDWRVPNINELESIVELKCYDPAINEGVFPGTPTSLFWSSSPNASSSNAAWVVNFGNGKDYTADRSYNGAVRLVRSGQ